MIKISNIHKTLHDDKVRVSVDIAISRETAERWYEESKKAPQYKDASYIVTDYLEHIHEITELWFETDIKYEKEVCDERGDAFVVAMLFYAMLTEDDIECDCPISSKLLFHLNDTLIPLLSYQSGIRQIRIYAPTIKEDYPNKSAVGTGMSCGIDSMSSLYQYFEKDVPEGYKLTHLTFFNVGADKGYVPKGLTWSEMQTSMQPFNETMLKKRENALRVAEKTGLELVFVDSNQMDIYQGLFEESHIYRSCSAVLFLQGLFSLYYISSTGCQLDDFQPKLRIDPGHYEIALIPLLCTENLQIESGGKAYNRVEKFRMIKDYPVAWEYLNVCSDAMPCYNCGKDFRMLIIFDILNCGKQFEKIYPAEQNAKTRWKAYNWLLKSYKYDTSAMVLWTYVKQQNIKIPIRSYMKYYVWKGLRLLKLR